MTCPCRETCIAIMRSQANTYSENLSGSHHFVNECAARIRALPCSCKYTVRVPRELRELLDTVSALDTFSAENPRDFSRMPSYLQVVHKRLLKEWGVVRALLTTQSANTVRVPRETVEHFANYWTVGDESGEAAHWTEAERKHCKVMFDLLNTKEPT